MFPRGALLAMSEACVDAIPRTVVVSASGRAGVGDLLAEHSEQPAGSPPRPAVVVSWIVLNTIRCPVEEFRLDNSSAASCIVYAPPAPVASEASQDGATVNGLSHGAISRASTASPPVGCRAFGPAQRGTPAR